MCPTSVIDRVPCAAASDLMQWHTSIVQVWLNFGAPERSVLFSAILALADIPRQFLNLCPNPTWHSRISTSSRVVCFLIISQEKNIAEKTSTRIRILVKKVSVNRLFAISNIRDWDTNSNSNLNLLYFRFSTNIYKLINKKQKNEYNTPTNDTRALCRV